jgi:hypothetical protein
MLFEMYLESKLITFTKCVTADSEQHYAIIANGLARTVLLRKHKMATHVNSI